jgi:tetratricopeptide (TPR) repeat protein
MSRRASSIARSDRRPVFECFEQAMSHHAQGRLSEAERLYETVLQADHRHFGCVHGLGLVRLQQGQFVEAAALFRRAIKIDKNSAEAHHHLAVALTGLGRPEEALDRFETALVIRPDFAEAHDSLGYALQVLGRYETAVVQHEQALAIKPEHAEAHSNLGNALQKLGRNEKAMAHYEKALAYRPFHAEAHNNLGNLLHNLGRHREAIGHYEQALAIRRGYAEAHINLGHALGAIGRREEGLAHYRQGLAAGPENPEIHNCVANMLLMLGRTEEAAAHCEQAISIRPDYVEAHHTLGNALRTLGKLDAAARAFERAIALAPERAAGYWNLVTSKDVAADDPHWLALNKLAQRIASLTPTERIDLHFALAKGLADIDEHTQSFRHLLAGNSLKREHVHYDESRTLQRFKRIKAVFTPALMQRKQGPADAASAPIFIIGMPRSGTTLIEQILASHPKVFGAGELSDFGRLVKTACGGEESSFPDKIPEWGSEAFYDLGKSYLQVIQQLAPDAERVTDKMPYNFNYAGLIYLALPNARIVHVCRDLRDVAFSCFALLFPHGQEYSYDLAELGRYCRAYASLMEHWRSVLPPGVMLEVQYEELVADLEGHARRILAHCGLEWHEACLAFYKTDRSVLTASAIQVRKPIYRGSIGRWRRHEAQLQPLLQELKGVSP